MPTNQEWLHKLANESPNELKAWFDAEHNDTLTAKNDVSGDSAHSNDEKPHLKAHSKTEPMLSEQSESLSEELDSREKLEADVREWVDDIGWLSDKETQVADFIAWLDRQAAITKRETFNHYRDELEELREAFDEICKCAHVPTDWKPIFAAGAVTGAIEGVQKLVNELQEQVDRLTAERDNLAKDLNDIMRSMDKLCDRFRDASSSALDNAHEIQRIIDNFWTV